MGAISFGSHYYLNQIIVLSYLFLLFFQKYISSVGISRESQDSGLWAQNRHLHLDSSPGDGAKQLPEWRPQEEGGRRGKLEKMAYKYL